MGLILLLAGRVVPIGLVRLQDLPGDQDFGPRLPPTALVPAVGRFRRPNAVVVLDHGEGVEFHARFQLAHLFVDAGEITLGDCPRGPPPLAANVCRRSEGDTGRAPSPEDFHHQRRHGRNAHAENPRRRLQTGPDSHDTGGIGGIGDAQFPEIDDSHDAGHDGAARPVSIPPSPSRTGERTKRQSRRRRRVHIFGSGSGGDPTRPARATRTTQK